MNFKKSQSSIEFVMIVGIVLLFFTIFFFSIQSSINDRMKERKTQEIKDIALMIQDEINLASLSIDGYLREFNIPKNINQREYNVSLLPGMIYIFTKDGKDAMALPVQNFSGEVKLGKNIIKKIGGEVRINYFLEINSTEFKNYEEIPNKYTACTGGSNINPPLEISKATKNSESYVLIFENIEGSKVYWVVWNISKNSLIIPEGIVPENAVVGKNGFNENKYHLPCPTEPGTYQYAFRIYSIDKNITLLDSETKEKLMETIQGHIIDRYELIVNYTKS